jgi:hypothetical protein
LNAVELESFPARRGVNQHIISGTVFGVAMNLDEPLVAGGISVGVEVHVEPERLAK